MSSFLPQFDPDPQGRKKQLGLARRRYRYAYNYISPLAMAQKLPRSEKFSFRWLTKVGSRAFRVLRNHRAIEKDDGRKEELDRQGAMFSDMAALGAPDTARLVSMVHEAVFSTAAHGPVKGLDDYRDLFAKIELPPIAEDFHKDEVFAYMRVAGPNPVLIHRVARLDDRFPVTDALYRSVMGNDSLAAAGAEGRLYLADFAILGFIVDGTYPSYQKYLYAPLALFALDKVSHALMPVAIQCDQQPGPDNPIFTPHDGFNWLIAKTIVEVADGNFHETVTHLGRTHLFVEPFVIATHRQLAENHPLARLLEPHFKGTLAINRAAYTSLMANDGGVDKLAGGTIDASRTAAAKGVMSYLFDEAMLPRTFSARGVDDRDLFPLYPYRDDSILFWEAIRKWVSEYLSIWYRTQSDLDGDVELGKWFAELRAFKGGRVPGLRAEIGTLDYLVDVATLVIFTASVQHAAVNFPQYDLMSYAPNMPLACYAPRPTEKTGATEADYLKMLPPLDQAEYQLSLGYVLGSVHYTTLGDYGRNHFDDRRADDPLATFQRRLEEIKTIIEERNRHRRPYEFLVPSGIPQSINI